MKGKFDMTLVHTFDMEVEPSSPSKQRPSSRNCAAPETSALVPEITRTILCMGKYHIGRIFTVILKTHRILSRRSLET